MVEMRRGGAGEWSREGELKGYMICLYAEYARRRWHFVNKRRRMNVRDEWASYSPSRVAPQELSALVPAINIVEAGVFFCLNPDTD